MTFILCVLLLCLGFWYLLFPKPADKDDLSITFKDTMTGSASSPKAEKPQEPAPSIGVQTWLFANGESFSSALEKCNAAGAASGRRYQCNVLQDDSGIYTGYRLDLR